MTNDDRPDSRLTELLHAAVADVEPADRLVEIRSRTARPARAAARPWLRTAGATALATAAAVTAFAVVGDFRTEPGPAGHEHHADGAGSVLVPAYYLGDTPSGLRLFREFDRVRADDPLPAALEQIQRRASDPDYSTPWSQGSFDDATLGDGTIDVELGDAEIALPAGRSDRYAELAVQQVVYTVQGAAGGRIPVRFLREGQPVATLLGVPVAQPVDAAPQNDVLNLMSISDPAEGNAYSDVFIARGRANSFEATVLWEIRDESGRAVRRDFTTASSGAGDRLYPWEAEVDVAGLAPGRYTFVALTDDPSGGAEGFGSASDTRTIIVR